MIEIIQQRLQRYGSRNAMEEDQALKEILQEVALYGLWRVNFFDVAAFQGGTSLRILHQLPRFSEDLDFILNVPNGQFEWARYLGPLTNVFAEFGLVLEVRDKSRMDKPVRMALLKDDSIGQQLDLRFARGPADRALKIKLEIDVNPPPGSVLAHSYLDFPLDFEVAHQDLPSNFALKIHALLCRPFLKGRDWFDFGWYVAQGVQPNLALLRSALDQQGPWQGQRQDIDANGLRALLIEKSRVIDWEQAADDVRRFLDAAQQQSLRLWNQAFFAAKIRRLV